jgi:hypothetical protein
MVIVCSFMLCSSSLGSYSWCEVINGHDIEEKLAANTKVKLIQEVESNSAMLQNEIVKCFVLPPSSLSNTFLWKA